jgi:SAM-dependent methyltransferase
MTVPDGDRWDRQIHYHPCLLDAVPARADLVLDVGCGEGCSHDDWPPRPAPWSAWTSIGPRSSWPLRHPQPNVEFLLGDVLHPPFGAATFDAVVCVMALHHVDANDRLQRMAELVRPGGVLAVIGVARSTAADLPRNAAGLVASAVHRRTKQEWRQTAPCAGRRR